MRRIDLNELRSIQLGILDEVDVFCKANGLRYSLGGGTLLGAVRHGGYIPWDDDIDIMMPREDYDRFAREFSSPDYVLQDLRKDPGVIECFLKVYKKGTMMRDTQLGRELWGIYIDIFPIDGAPESFQEHCNQIFKLRDQLPRVCPFYKSVSKNKPIWFVKYVFKRIAFLHYRNVLDIKKEIETLAYSVPFETSPNAGVLLGSYGIREVLNKSVFNMFTNLPFEGKMYPAIKKYDVYLRAIYGDYMTLPPVAQRVTHHLYESFVNDRPSQHSSMIPVAIAFTPDYFIPAATTLRSLLDSSSGIFKIICLVTEAIPERMQEMIIEMGEGRLFLECRSLKGRLKDIYISPRYTEAASFRLLLPELFPEYNRMFYIDCDIIIRQDIGHLYNEMDLQDNYLAGVYEASSEQQIDRIQKLGCNPNKYFNSGFLLMNLDQMRKEKVTERLIDACKVDYLVFPDQDALNIVCQGRTVPLNPKYNAIRTYFIPKYKPDFLALYTEKDWDIVQKEGTIHYTGAGAKPWKMFTIQFDKWWSTYERLPQRIRDEWRPPKRVLFYWSVYRHKILRLIINAIRWLKRQLFDRG